MQNDYLTNKEFTLYTNLDFEMPRNTTYGVQKNIRDAARFFFANRDGLKVYEPKKLCYTTVDRFIETKLFSAQGQITLRPTEDGGFILEE